jgi:hypothetical protein
MNADIGSIGEDSDHVEPQCIEVRFSGIEVMLGDGAQGALLAGCDGFERVSVAGSAPQLDLDEDECVGSLVQNTMTSEVRFRAELSEYGVERLELARA